MPLVNTDSHPYLPPPQPTPVTTLPALLVVGWSDGTWLPTMKAGGPVIRTISEVAEPAAQAFY